MEMRRMDRSLGDLFSDLSLQMSDLLRQEMRLAKAEISEKLAVAGRHAMMIGVSIAYVLAHSAISSLRKKSLAPVETIHSLKETTQWLKNETR